MAKAKKKKEGTVAKTLRTWSPGKYIGKFIKGEPIGVSEEKAKASKKKATAEKEKRKSVAAKRTKTHKESVAKKDKGTGLKDWYPGKYAKKLIKGEPVGVPKGKKKAAPQKAAPQKAAPQKAAAKKKAGESWTKAVKKQKKKGEAGVSLSSLIASRKGLKKGTAEYAKIQNAINKAYGVEKRHKAKASKKAQAGGIVAKLAKKSKDLATKVKAQKAEATKPVKASGEYKEPGNYSKGGKVEASNPYGWPTRDARDGGQK